METQQVLDLNKQLLESENHFNNLQSEYRKIASGWLLASFAGIGFALTNAKILPIDQNIFLAFICYGASLGLILLWNMDLSVYQKLLDANFKEGLKLEQEYSWLPQVRHNMLAYHGNSGVLKRVIWFYSMPILVFVTIAAYLITVYYADKSMFIKALIWFLHLFVYSLFSYFVRNETQRWKK
ncbi:hypothetical protein EZ449_08570 [Pedobacter frigidisoli]|uniref:Uncharacterized protein n=1 Tax=Pedobacter frigidisoli TaxID=2530455 RepID=A0A4R0P0Y8_9SPHI|nr:hypothetical protein [Pedobacter frigidisoli]TCD10395.1 hypothetical protein EZ449_08570 [Pedobacter frigidisoli]